MHAGSGPQQLVREQRWYVSALPLFSSGSRLAATLQPRQAIISPRNRPKSARNLKIHMVMVAGTTRDSIGAKKLAERAQEILSLSSRGARNTRRSYVAMRNVKRGRTGEIGNRAADKCGSFGTR